MSSLLTGFFALLRMTHQKEIKKYYAWDCANSASSSTFLERAAPFLVTEYLIFSGLVEVTFLRIYHASTPSSSLSVRILELMLSSFFWIWVKESSSCSPSTLIRIIIHFFPRKLKSLLIGHASAEIVFILYIIKNK